MEEVRGKAVGLRGGSDGMVDVVGEAVPQCRAL
jgi:hypothetical protein